MTPNSSATVSHARTLTLCFLACLVEGFDLQSAGLLAGKYAVDLGFGPAAVGLSFSANTFGLLIGAPIGGVMGDRIGRKWSLVSAMVFFALGSLATAASTGGEMFHLARFLTGMGLGGALPNLIAVVAEAGPVERTTRRVTVLTACIPIGAAIGAVILSVFPTVGWRAAFAAGGWLPLALSVLFALRLSETQAFKAARSMAAHGHPVGADGKLFGPGRTVITLALWMAFFATLAANYMLLNWVPSLATRLGLSRFEVTAANLSYVLGSVAGALLLGLNLTKPVVQRQFPLAYLLGLVGVVWVALAGNDTVQLCAALALAGAFIAGCQFVLYGFAPTLYPAPVRAKGVGASIAAGRVGAVAGPGLAGLILGAGGSPATVVLSLVPIVLLALGSAFLVTRLLRPSSPAATTRL